MIIGSCGHEFTHIDNDGMGYNVVVKDYCFEGGCVSYKCVCKSCKEMYKNNNTLINNKKEMEEYLDEDLHEVL